MRKLTMMALAGAATFAMGPADAALLWGNNAGSSVLIEAFDATTGAIVHSYTPGQSGNGRGIVVVGNTVYYTIVGDGTVYELNASTGASVGSFSSGLASLSTISYDGTNFWMADYAGTNKAFQISSTGTLLKTISLAKASGNMDGLEYFNGKLIANRSDGGHVYDVYDLDGNLLSGAFITNPSLTPYVTGIAYDGTNFYSSNATEHSVSLFSGTTGALLSTLALTGYGGIGIEDLSVDFAGRVDTCGGPGQPPCTTGVPEPASMTLLGLAMLGLGVARRQRTR